MSHIGFDILPKTEILPEKADGTIHRGREAMRVFRFIFDTL